MSESESGESTGPCEGGGGLLAVRVKVRAGAGGSIETRGWGVYVMGGCCWVYRPQGIAPLGYRSSRVSLL